MAASNDWYPRDPVELTVFYENLAVTLPEVAVRLEIDEDTLERVRRNANWLIYWTQKRSEIENHGKALTAYYQHVAWGNGKGEKAHAPLISPSEPPPEVPVGIDSFTRNLRRRILSHPNYTLVEGALLGLAKTTTSLNETNINAEFSTEKISPNDASR